MKVTKFLDINGIDYKKVDNKLLAKNSYIITENNKLVVKYEWLDITNYTTDKLLDWLGY